MPCEISAHSKLVRGHSEAPPIFSSCRSIDVEFLVQGFGHQAFGNLSNHSRNFEYRIDFLQLQECHGLQNWRSERVIRILHDLPPRRIPRFLKLARLHKHKKMVIQHKNYPVCPPWLKPLISAKFFEPCNNHEENRSECNLYCLNCMTAPLCFTCTIHHKNHHIVQIRRSSYHDVIRVSEIQKVLDLSGVQSYIINSARVVFLNGRPQSKLAKGVTKTCEICERSLHDSFSYCSLGCKLEGIKRHNAMTFILQPKHQQVSSNVHRVYPEDGSPKKSRSKKAIAPNKPIVSLDTAEQQAPAELLQDGSTEDDIVVGFTAAAAAPTTAATLNDLEVILDFAGTPETSSASDHAVMKNFVEEMSPSTPPQLPVAQRPAKRRKGTPHRSHLGL